MAKRYYSPTTIKILFARSGNQCAHPNCTNPIVAPGTEHSDEAVVGQICHIYAASDEGPRGNPNLTEEQRNAPENLLLLCGHHHPLVDRQWETYPARFLKTWKKEHEAKFDPETAEAAKRLAAVQQLAFVQDYTDHQIDEEVERIRKGRYIAGFPVTDAALALANRVQATELAGGSTDVRARALAWCARVLSQGETAARATELLAASKALGQTSEARIAEAFIASNTDRDQALALLVPLNNAAGRSAALRIIMNKDGVKGTASWLERTGSTIDDLDSDGKFAYLMHAFAAESWQMAIEAAEKITDEDLQSTPVLYLALANASLIQAVRDQSLRASVLIHVPTESDRFPLASDEAGLAARRRAMNFFTRISNIVRSMGLVAASNPASDYALWLKLRDPQLRDGGLEDLRASMRNPDESLRRVIFALQFGVKVDLEAIEKEIDKRVALSGKGTADAAYARYALAFTKSDPRSAAEYLAKYRDQLYEHLHKASIQTIEIELLARGGLIGTAEEMLERAAADGLGEEEQRHLRRIIAEAKGADPAAERKAQFKQTDTTRDLVNLTSFLEDKESWHELHPYAHELFKRTGSLEDATRLVKALQEAGRYIELFDFLASHQDLVAQSPTLKTLWAWSLYRAGRFAEATDVRKTLPSGRNDANHRAMRVNIAIASGDWEDLVDFSNDEWRHRDERSAMRLEPRWIPEFVVSRQLWNEFGGRVWSTAHLHSDIIAEMGWSSKLGTQPDSELKKRLDLPQAFMPGPLEGGTQAVKKFDADDVAKVRAELSQPIVAASSFLTLANSSFLRRIPEELCDLAADALVRTEYRLDGLDEEASLAPLLLGLANAASATRSHRLADALFILLRVYRRLYADELAPEDAFRVAMIASASRTELPEWCKCVGAAMNDIAFQTITVDQAFTLHSHTVNLCHLVPELWATCGQAEAALRAVIEA